MAKTHGGGLRTAESEIDGISSLLEYVDIDLSSGNCVWKKTIGQRAVKGSVAGSKRKDGYTAIKFKRCTYKRHRVVFYAANGYLPLIVDHKHGVEAGDGIDNLQEATHQQNMMKQGKYKNNTSGFTGVDILPSGRFRAAIRHNGKRIGLGTYDTAKEASDVYNAKASEIFGEFYNAVK